MGPVLAIDILSSDDTAEYLRMRLRRAGCDRELFASDAAALPIEDISIDDYGHNGGGFGGGGGDLLALHVAVVEVESLRIARGRKISALSWSDLRPFRARKKPIEGR